MKNHVLIFGGGLINKGAQAMTFIAVNEAKHLIPNAEITLFSSVDFYRESINKYNYLFDIKPFSTQTLLYYLGGVYRVLSNIIGIKKHTKPDREIENILNSSCYMINVSGYALSSKWGFKNCLTYLLTIKLMKKYQIETILMPQSFGPFDFKGGKKIIHNYYAKKYLKYPKKIFAREEDGLKILVGEYGLKNVELSADMVLQNKGIDYDLLLKDIKKNIPSVPTDAVAIIPNVRSTEKSKVALGKVYSDIIQYYLNKNIPVVILSHSNFDENLCKGIKDNFIDNPKVIYINQELQSYEYQELVERFRYVIAARYHSIVHAYKANIPCITLGWAVKYYELMKLFNQEKYSISVEKLDNKDAVIALIEDMETNLDQNKAMIKQGLTRVQNNNCFNVLEGYFIHE